MTLRTPHLNALIVSLAAGYTFIAVGFGIASFLSSSSESAMAMRKGDPIETLAMAPRGAADVSVLKNRPLFTMTRRSRSLEPAAEPPPVEAVPQTAGFEDFKVVAVAIVEGKAAMATLESSSGEKARVKIGSDLRGWQVKKIERSGITLESGGEEKRIDVRKPIALNDSETIRVGQGGQQPEQATP